MKNLILRCAPVKSHQFYFRTGLRRALLRKDGDLKPVDVDGPALGHPVVQPGRQLDASAEGGGEKFFVQSFACELVLCIILLISRLWSPDDIVFGTHSEQGARVMGTPLEPGAPVFVVFGGHACRSSLLWESVRSKLGKPRACCCVIFARGRLG